MRRASFGDTVASVRRRPAVVAEVVRAAATPSACDQCRRLALEVDDLLGEPAGASARAAPSTSVRDMARRLLHEVLDAQRAGREPEAIAARVESYLVSAITREREACVALAPTCTSASGLADAIRRRRHLR